MRPAAEQEFAPGVALVPIGEPSRRDWFCFVEAKPAPAFEGRRGDSAVWSGEPAGWPAAVGPLAGSIVIGFARAAAGVPTHIPTRPSG